MDNADKIRRLAAIGEAIHGERWQRPLARQLGVSAALMSSVATGERRITPDLEERLERALVSKIIPGLEATTWTLARSLAPEAPDDVKIVVLLEETDTTHRLTCDELGIMVEASSDEIRAPSARWSAEDQRYHVSSRLERLVGKRFAEALWAIMPDRAPLIVVNRVDGDEQRTVSGYSVRRAYERIADDLARERDAELFFLRELGVGRYGENWISSMSLEMGMSRQDLFDIAMGRVTMDEKARVQFRKVADRMSTHFEVMARMAKEASEVTDAPAVTSETA